jgi:predicted NBD/HSP70 family sugar kinase
MRAINRSTVLNTVKAFGPIARAEIARRTGLSPATVTSISMELVRDKLIFEKATGDSSGGRRPILLALNPHGGYVIGIKLTETQATSALTDLEANIIAKATNPLSGHSPESVVKDLSQAVSALLSRGGIRKVQLLGVGIGLAGIIDASQGMLRQSPIYKWHDVPLKDMLQKLIRVPVYLDNDVNTLTLAERWIGSGQKEDNFLTVTIGRGVGMGIVVNGQFYRGVGGGAGELGHIVMDPAGPLCECGKRGCLETYVGDPGLLREAALAHARGEISAPVETVEDLSRLAADGDEVARRIYARAGEILGQAIANLVNIFNPKKIVISGEGTRAGDWIFKPMCQAISQNAMPALAADVEIRIDRWGDDTWAYGAASLVLRELFESPVHREAATA